MLRLSCTTLTQGPCLPPVLRVLSVDKKISCVVISAFVVRPVTINLVPTGSEHHERQTTCTTIRGLAPLLIKFPLAYSSCSSVGLVNSSTPDPMPVPSAGPPRGWVTPTVFI
jgi:hypothetical protein